jgi:hypothetical protein
VLDSHLNSICEGYTGNFGCLQNSLGAASKWNRSSLDQTGCAGLAILHNPGERHKSILESAFRRHVLEQNVINRLSIAAGLDEIKHIVRVMFSLRGALNLSNSRASCRSNYFRINGF